MPQLILDYLGFLIVVLALFLFVVFSLLARRGFKPTLRPLHGYSSLPDQVGQAVESGGRVHISLGPNSIIDRETGVTLAGLAMLDVAVESAAISDLPPVATTSDATTLPVMSDTIRRTYHRMGEEEKFKPKNARLVALDPVSLAAGATSIIHDDKVQANVLVGSFGPEVALMTEAGHRRGIPQTVGSDLLEGQAVAYTMADYPLIGEEIFTARAYLTETPSAIGWLASEDVLRWVVVGLILFGTVLQTLGLLR